MSHLNTYAGCVPSSYQICGIPIDTVYQRVLAIVNKEQRGYITPLEFNLLANQAQLDIFEKYFYDLDQTKRRESDTGTFSDMEQSIKNKLRPFTSDQIMSTVSITSGSQFSLGANFPANYRIGRIFLKMGSPFQDVYVPKKVEIIDILNLRNSKFHNLGLQKNPVYTESTHWDTDVEFYTGGVPPTVNGVICEVITKPDKVEWGYDVIAEKALYNASRSNDFQLHASEETNLVTRILELAGVIIQDPGVIQYADQEGTKKIQLEKA